MFFCQTSGIVGPDEAGSKHNGLLTDVSLSPHLSPLFPPTEVYSFVFLAGRLIGDQAKGGGSVVSFIF